MTLNLLHHPIHCEEFHQNRAHSHRHPNQQIFPAIHHEHIGIVRQQSVTWKEPLLLDSGATLAPVTLAYETYGHLNKERDNAILLLHALSGDAHAAGKHSPTDRKPGWWDTMIGPGKSFDTNRYFLICSNVIGGCKGSTGPSSVNPKTGLPYAITFPVITIADMVRAQVRLLDYLGIDRLLAVAGGSMGGFQALEWATAYPERVRGTILLATTARSSPQTIAWNSIGRHAIMSDPRWQGGNYYGQEPPVDGLSIARKMAHITYLSEMSLEKKFGRSLQNHTEPQFTLEQEFEVEHYLEYQGKTFNTRFDANSYLYITKAMDYWDLPRQYGSLKAALARTHANFLLISFTSDWLYPPAESYLIEETLRQLRREVTHIEIPSIAGHDAFLVDSDLQHCHIAEFLGDLSAGSEVESDDYEREVGKAAA